MYYGMTLENTKMNMSLRHHQASVYHQASGALRSTSPYSLPPITSATFSRFIENSLYSFSRMSSLIIISSSMFSPSSLLGSQHQAAVAGHLPHIKTSGSGGSGDFDAPTSGLGHQQRKDSRQSKSQRPWSDGGDDQIVLLQARKKRHISRNRWTPSCCTWKRWGQWCKPSAL